MAVKRVAFAVLVLISLLGTTMISSVQGHTAQAHMVLIKENGLTQGSPEIKQTDSVIWENIDDSSNLTHRIVYDHDGDGLYNGTFDWDSGELQSDCETDENNTKIDSSCSTSFVVTFDMNWSVGNYSYQDIRSDNSTMNATIQLFADSGDHVEENLPAIGSNFGVNNNDNQVDDDTKEKTELTPEEMLLYVGLFTGISSVLLLGILVLRRSNSKTLDNVRDESE